MIKKLDTKLILQWAVAIGVLALIIYMAIAVRLSTLSQKTILDYDPWWYYRHAIEIMNNNMQPLKWDLLSYYPPGRPFEPFMGWEYTMILFYKIAQIFSSGVQFLFVAKLSPVIMVALATIPAFLLGRMLTNNIGGLVTALFAVLTPTFIGVSMAGYTDNDPVVAFYTFLSVLSILVALKKKSIPLYVLSILVNVLFAYTWNGGWFVLLLFIAFLPGLFIFRLFESFVHHKKFVGDITHAVVELKSLLVPLLAIIIGANLIGIIANLGNVFISFLISLGFINPGQGLLVNISVAELQRINILTRDGFVQVAGRIGLAPTLFAIIGLPLLVLYKLYKKVRIEYHEIFLFIWTAATFYFILNGTRFALQFSAAAAASSGYVIGQFSRYKRVSIMILFSTLLAILSINFSFYLLPTFLVGIVAAIALLKHRDENAPLYLATLFGVTLVLMLIFITEAASFGQGSSGLAVDDNWLNGLDWLKQNADEDALVTTWWDPGHIIAGYTGLKVHADGAHCAPGECIP